MWFFSSCCVCVCVRVRITGVFFLAILFMPCFILFYFMALSSFHIFFFFRPLPLTAEPLKLIFSFVYLHWTRDRVRVRFRGRAAAARRDGACWGRWGQQHAYNPRWVSRDLWSNLPTLMPLEATRCTALQCQGLSCRKSRGDNPDNTENKSMRTASWIMLHNRSAEKAFVKVSNRFKAMNISVPNTALG